MKTQNSLKGQVRVLLRGRDRRMTFHFGNLGDAVELCLNVHKLEKFLSAESSPAESAVREHNQKHHKEK